MKTEKFNITYAQFGKLMATKPDWLFKVMYSDLTPEDFLDDGLSPNPTFIFDSAEEASRCFELSISNETFNNTRCGFVEDEDDIPWSFTCSIHEFKLNGKCFSVGYHTDNINGKIIDWMTISYSPNDQPQDSSTIHWMFQNYKRFKKLKVNLSEPRYRIKKQICDWLTNETFD